MSRRRPETRYTPVGGADVAYQVVGEGPATLLYFNPLGSNIDRLWVEPDHSEFWLHVSSFCRIILFDRRGTGVSDAVPSNRVPTWEDLSEDAGAVLDAAGVDQAAILATAETGPMGVLFAAMHPDRVSGLALVNTYARYTSDVEYPMGVSSEIMDAFVDAVLRGWGSIEFARLAVPSRADDPDFLEEVATTMRSSATPRNAAAQYDYLARSIDVRRVLPLLQVPTVVMHSRLSSIAPWDQGCYLAEHIDGAKLVELPGGDVSMSGEHTLKMADELAEFLTGEPQIEIDRVLTTILFTDIVESTANVAALGDRRWRSLLDSHDRLIRDELRRFKGREVNTTGDGFVAAFDGPARAVRCAKAIRAVTGARGIAVRVGLHTGECEVRGNDIAGLAVHIAARVGALARANEVLVSSTVRDLVVGSGLDFEGRGEIELRGVPGRWRLYAAVD